MKEIAFTFFFVGLLIFCISLGKWIAYWWEDRPMSKKQKEKYGMKNLREDMQG